MLLVTDRNVLVITKEGALTDDLINEPSMEITHNEQNILMMTDIYDKFEVIFAFKLIDMLPFLKTELKEMVKNNRGVKCVLDFFCPSPYDDELYFVINAKVEGTNEFYTITSQAILVELCPAMGNPDSGMKFDYNYRRSFTVNPSHLLAMSMAVPKKKDDITALFISLKQDTIPYIDFYYKPENQPRIAYRILTY